MLRLKKIAITGGVASGKTSVCRFFKELGAHVVDADSIVHEFLSPSTSLGQQVIRHFGPEILQQGKINRKALSVRVFENTEELKYLEQLLHPEVLRKIEELYNYACQLKDRALFVVEIPLIFEIQQEDNYDAVIAVLADEDVCKTRFEKAGHTAGEYDRRMSRHLTPMQKAKKADYIIKNNGTLDDLRQEVVKLNNLIQNQ